MIIYSKAHRVIKDYKGGRICDVPQGYVGAVDEWVTATDYFKLNLNDGTFTLVENGVTQDAAADTNKPPKK